MAVEVITLRLIGVGPMLMHSSKQVTPEGTKLYLSAFGVSAEVINPGTSSQIWTDYLSVGDAMVGMRTIQTASETVATRYFHTDHLGSISVITSETGTVVERLSYDAWGKRRNSNGTDDATGSITSQSSRGFTGEEQLSVAGLVHLNGRVYDPIIARMTSADPTIPRPLSTQGWNRYAYASNRPTRNVDTDGFADFSNGEGPDIGGCNCFNYTSWYVYPTPLPTPTVFPSYDAVAASNALGASVSAMIQAGNAAAWAQATTPILPVQYIPPAGAPSPPISGAPSGYQPSPGPSPAGQAPSVQQSPSSLRRAGEDLLGCAMDIGCQMSLGDLPGAAVLGAGKLLGAAVVSIDSLRASRLGAFAGIPGRVRSRINVPNVEWGHMIDRHFAGSGSRFTIGQEEVRTLLGSKQVVESPIIRTLPNAEKGTTFLREVDIGRTIGVDKLTGKDTTVLSVITDRFGNMQTAFPGKLPQ